LDWYNTEKDITVLLRRKVLSLKVYNRRMVLKVNNKGGDAVQVFRHSYAKQSYSLL